ncbi:MAG: protein FlhF [Deltaproteobacteria bacterium]|jgi:flagellar biosynthesis protein FlhF|nr:protein FlhF [Deltaproteobacteria bacterium]
MNKKIYRARNIQQAISNIKQELGSDAMILSTRKISPKSIDPYSKKKKIMFEVEASVPEYADVQPVKKKSSSGFKQNDITASIKDDIADIKDMISIAGFGNGMHNMVCNHFESVGILASLLRAGVSETQASYIIQKASSFMDKNCDQDSKIKSLKQHVMHQCLNQINTIDFFNGDNSSKVPHVAAFVGPTGVGKTTTIAKLSALLHFQKKMKVGLISIDNYRVGAFEQLKAYASIMGLFCVPAFNSQDLSCALDSMRSMDMVLIDTAGHSHFDKPKIDEILQLIKNGFAISIHLVLSVTSESNIMREAVSAFSVFNPDTIVFTKIDEAKRCGKIMDQVCDTKLPVSLITNGQRVPEDLIIPDRGRLLKIILRRG